MLNQRRKLSVLRNSERRSRSAKRSFKHGASRVSGAKQFPHTDLIIWFVFYQEKMNKRNPSKVKLSLVSQNLKQKFTIDQVGTPYQIWTSKLISSIQNNNT